MNYLDYIKPELLVLVVALIGLGAILKKLDKIKDNFIPLILMGVGIVLACLYVFATEGITTIAIFTAIVQGIICSACAVFGNQVVKQISELTKKDE